MLMGIERKADLDNGELNKNGERMVNVNRYGRKTDLDNGEWGDSGEC